MGDQCRSVAMASSATTGLSLVCNQCNTQLRSAKEAQDHAEISGHTNFSESTEAVLNLVCTVCGKPCRSKTETDLHTKRTGHADFSDKTLETAKPIELEQVKESAVSGSEPMETGSESQRETSGNDASSSVEMVAPSVNKEVQAELEAMGFSSARSIRALHFSGGDNVETAVNWIVEHEDDPDIDEMLLVPVTAIAEKKQPLSAEEARVRAQELRERARRKKEEEEKRMEREREKERIRASKDLLEAKKIEEQQDRKRIIALRKAEKEEEKRAREKILARLREDKEERRRKLGLPPEEPSAPQVSTPMETAKTPAALPMRPASKAEQMRELLRGLKQAHQTEDARVKKAFQTLLTFVSNLAQSPDEEKFRRIRITNSAFQERVGSLKNGIEFLQLCGFVKNDSGEFLEIKREKVNSMVLNTAGGELNSAIVNPFFGVL